MIYEYLRNILEVFFLLVVKRFTWNGKLTLVMRINWRSKREGFYELKLSFVSFCILFFLLFVRCMKSRFQKKID